MAAQPPVVTSRGIMFPAMFRIFVNNDFFYSTFFKNVLLTFFLLLLGSKCFFTFTLSITSTLAPWFTRCWFVKPKTSSIRYSRIVESYISVPPLSQLGCVSTIWECPSGNNLTTWNFTRLWHFQLLFGCNWALVIDVLSRIFLSAVDVGLFSDMVLKCSLVRWHHVKVEAWVN